MNMLAIACAFVVGAIVAALLVICVLRGAMLPPPW
jgi:uncharacterized membrane protein YoaK (UPF0700 family)